MKTANLLKKSAASLLMLSLLSSPFTAGANPLSASPENDAAEVQLIASLESISGQSLTQQSLQSELAQAFQDYDQTASHDRRDVRFQQALVNTGVMTSAQAAHFTEQLQIQTTHQNLSGEEVTAVVRNALKSTGGAMFSSCNVATYTSGTALIAGSVALFVLAAKAPRIEVTQSTTVNGQVTSYSSGKSIDGAGVGELLGGIGASITGVVLILMDATGNLCN